MAEFSDEETPVILSLELLGIIMDDNEKVKDFNERFIFLLNRKPIKHAEAVLSIILLLYCQTLLCL